MNVVDWQPGRLLRVARCVVLIAIAAALSSSRMPAQILGLNLGATPSTRVLPGGKLAVPVIVDLTNAGAASIASLSASLMWGTATLTFDSLRAVPVPGWSLTPGGLGSGVLSFVTTSGSPLATTSALANAYFTASAAPGGTRVTPRPTAAFNASAVNVVSLVLPRAQDVCVALFGKWGDTNSDGAVNIVDAQQVARFAVGLSVSDQNALSKRGDVTANGSVDIIDGQQIARFSVGLTATSRIGSESFVPPVTSSATLTPAGPLNRAAGDTLSIQVTPRDGAGTDLTGCSSFSWTSSNSAVAIVSGSGFVRALSAGTTTITATSIANPSVVASVGLTVGTPAPIAVTVDNGVNLQVIDGFGANTHSLVYGGNDYLGSLRQGAIQATFAIAGISLAQLNVGLIEAPANAADPFGARANDNVDPNVMNAAGFNFLDSDAARDKAWNLANPSGLRGPDIGPLINLPMMLTWLLPVREANYSLYLDELAEHVLAIVQRWRDAYGVTPRYVHLFNEPTSGNNELASSNTQEVVDIVKRVGQRLQSAGLSSVKFVVPNEETMERSLEVAGAILADPAARPFVGVIGYHPYPYGSAYSSPRRILDASGVGVPDETARQHMEQLKALGQQYGVPVWMTEVSEGPGTNDYDFFAIEPVLARAIHIRDNFVFAGATAFFGMNSMWDSQSHVEHFGTGIPFLSEQSDIVLIERSNGSMLTTPMGHAIGHYARFLRPGSRSIGAESEHPRVIVSAFRDATASKIVVVVVNTDYVPQALQLVIRGATAGSPATGETSYGSVRWQPINPVAKTGAGTFLPTVPARSVTTFVLPLSG